MTKLFENCQSRSKKHRRVLSVLLVSLAVILMIILLLTWLIPMVMDYAVEFAKNIDTYVKSFEASINSSFEDPNLAGTIIQVEQTFVDSIKSLSANDFMEVIAFAGKTGSTLLTILMGFICPYILIEAEKLARIFDRFMLCFISQENLDLIHGYAIKSHRIFGNFIYGKFIDSVIIGLIALVGFGLMGLPFFPLLAFVVFITNINPYFRTIHRWGARSFYRIINKWDNASNLDCSFHFCVTAV
ncbi:MAG: AI-2E family transporter [Thomasclavelia ramosa]